MSTVRELQPGQVVTGPAGSATFITHTQHPIWPHLRLVIWRLADGGISLDALDAGQDVGQAAAATLPQRLEALRAALLGSVHGAGTRPRPAASP